jgi:hypothetical protein
MLEWVEHFYFVRPPEPIGCVPPAEAKAGYWRQPVHETIAVASTLTSVPPRNLGRFRASSAGIMHSKISPDLVPLIGAESR